MSLVADRRAKGLLIDCLVNKSLCFEWLLMKVICYLMHKLDIFYCILVCRWQMGTVMEPTLLSMTLTHQTP